MTTEAGDDGKPVIGVIVSGRYDFPIDVNVDTSQIGGPSAGLAMTLSILDKLTPGDLTGGKKVAVTGTIAEDGIGRRDRRHQSEGGQREGCRRRTVHRARVHT